MFRGDHEAMNQLIVSATLVQLITAALIFAFQTLRQAKGRSHKDASFPTVLLLALVGWIATEAVSDSIGASLGDVGRWTHLSVMVLFAGAVTFQLKRAREA
jgi:hypothetical protein